MQFDEPLARAHRRRECVERIGVRREHRPSRAISSPVVMSSFPACSTSAALIVGSSSIRTSPAFTVGHPDVDGAHDSGFERLNDLGATGRHDLARRCRDDVDRPDTPRPMPAEEGDDRAGNRASCRRGWRLDDLECRRKEFRSSPSRRRGRRSETATMFLTTFIAVPTCSAIEHWHSAAAAKQLVMRAVLNHAPVLEGDDAVGLAHGREAMGDDDDRAAVRRSCACCAG